VRRRGAPDQIRGRGRRGDDRAPGLGQTAIAIRIESYSERHLVKPGLTGWAQVCYPYGASFEDAQEKHQYDLYYIKNQSPLLDAIILLETARVVLFGRFSR
jgi:lipopolysaccharide/colanic/teichoic acid biosynthesis glycosyltransferase